MTLEKLSKPYPIRLSCGMPIVAEFFSNASPKPVASDSALTSRSPYLVQEFIPGDNSFDVAAKATRNEFRTTPPKVTIYPNSRVLMLLVTL